MRKELYMSYTQQVLPTTLYTFVEPTRVFALWLLGAGVIGEKGGAKGEDGGYCVGSESLTLLE